jgi:hypothetical protein
MEIVLSSGALARIADYKKRLESGAAVPGARLALALTQQALVNGSFNIEDQAAGDAAYLRSLSDQDFVKLLVSTKRPKLFLESFNIDGTGIWTREELQLLGDVGILFDDTVADDSGSGTRYDPAQPTPLFYMPAPCTTENAGDSQAIPGMDIDRIANQGPESEAWVLDDKKYSQVMADKAWTTLAALDALAARRDQKIVVRVPSGEAFNRGLSKDDRQKLPALIEKVWAGLLAEGAFPHIQAAVFISGAEPVGLGHRVHETASRLIIRPTIRGEVGRRRQYFPALPTAEDCLDDVDGMDTEGVVIACSVAADHASWPANDANGSSAQTLEGRIGMSSNTREVMLGREERLARGENPVPVWATTAAVGGYFFPEKLLATAEVSIVSTKHASAEEAAVEEAAAAALGGGGGAPESAAAAARATAGGGGDGSAGGGGGAPESAAAAARATAGGGGDGSAGGGGGDDDADEAQGFVAFDQKLKKRLDSNQEQRETIFVRLGYHEILRLLSDTTEDSIGLVDRAHLQNVLTRTMPQTRSGLVDTLRILEEMDLVANQYLDHLQISGNLIGLLAENPENPEASFMSLTDALDVIGRVSSVIVSNLLAGQADVDPDLSFISTIADLHQAVNYLVAGDYPLAIAGLDADWLLGLVRGHQSDVEIPAQAIAELVREVANEDDENGTDRAQALLAKLDLPNLLTTGDAVREVITAISEYHMNAIKVFVDALSLKLRIQLLNTCEDSNPDYSDVRQYLLRSLPVGVGPTVEGLQDALEELGGEAEADKLLRINLLVYLGRPYLEAVLRQSEAGAFADYRAEFFEAYKIIRSADPRPHFGGGCGAPQRGSQIAAANLLLAGQRVRVKGKLLPLIARATAGGVIAGRASTLSTCVLGANKERRVSHFLPPTHQQHRPSSGGGGGGGD